jgi:dipeptidyl aminopeptidase/acylaminoacyl peptidase
MPPTLLIHGDKDPLVPIQQSIIFDKKLEELGVSHQLIVVPGGVHGGTTISPENIGKLVTWFVKTLG